MKASFHDKEDDSNTLNKDTFETFQIRKSKWTPPEGQFASLDFSIKKCRHSINKLKFLTITTPRTSCIYFLPKIHKPNNPGRPIVSVCSYNKDTFETIQIRKSKWTPPEGKFASLDFSIKKCRHSINKRKFSPSSLLELRVFTFYLKSINLTTQVDPSFLPAVVPPNLFTAI